MFSFYLLCLYYSIFECVIWFLVKRCSICFRLHPVVLKSTQYKNSVHVAAVLEVPNISKWISFGFLCETGFLFLFVS